MHIEAPETAFWVAQSKPHSWSTEEIQYVVAIADQVAIAIRNARLLGDLKQVVRARDQVRIAQQAVVESFVAHSGATTMLQSLAELTRSSLVIVDDIRSPGLCLGADPTGEERLADSLQELIGAGNADLARLAQAHIATSDPDAPGLVLRVAGLDADIRCFALSHRQPGGLQHIGILLAAERSRADRAPGDPAGAIEAAALGLALELVRRRAALDTELRLRTGLLADLLEGRMESIEDVRQRALFMGLDIDKPVAFGLMRYSQLDRGGRLAEQRLRVIDRAIGILKGIYPRGVVATDAHDVVLLLPLASRATDSMVPIRALHSRLRAALPEGELSVVTGRICHAPEDYRPAMLEARRALDTAIPTVQGQVTDLTTLGAGRFLLSFAADSSMLEDLLRYTIGEPTLNALSDRDLATVEAYLEHSCSLQRTADALAIHVSTLRYRLRKLQDSFGWDLDEPDLRFALQLALRTKRLTGARTDRTVNGPTRR